MAVFLDGCVSREEALAIFVRSVNEEFKILAIGTMMVLAKSLSANQLARQIITMLGTELQTPASIIICAVCQWCYAVDNEGGNVSRYEEQYLGIPHLGCCRQRHGNTASEQFSPMVDCIICTQTSDYV